LCNVKVNFLRRKVKNREKEMSATSKVTNKETIAFKGNNAIPPKSPNMQTSTITDPIDLTNISKISKNSSTISSIVKAVMVFAGTLSVYYLTKTTGIFSYFGRKVKTKNAKNTLTTRRNLETIKQVNNPSINQVTETYKGEDKTAKFEEIAVKKFKDLFKVKKENVIKQKSINIKNPISNQYVTVEYVTVDKLFNLTIDGTNVFSSNSSLFLEAISIPYWLTSSNPNPTFKGSYTMNYDSAYGIVLLNNYAYVAADPGLQIIDVSDPANPTLKGSYNKTSGAQGIALSGNYAYLTTCKEGLQIINITDPTNPTFEGSYDLIEEACGIALSGNYAYVADLESLQIINIRDPSNPKFKGSYDILEAYGVALSGNYAYLTSWKEGLQIINITDPTNPTFKGSYNKTELASGIVLAGNYAYLADEDGLQIIDISNPINPTLKGSYETSDAIDVVLSGNYAYVATYQSGLQIIDITNLANPTFKSSYNTAANANRIVFSSNYAYVTDLYHGLEIASINLDKLTLLGTPNSLGTYIVDIKACNGKKECITNSFNIIVSIDLTTTLIITITICLIGFCCSLIGGVGIIRLKRYRNRNKNLKSAIPINDSQVVTKNNYLTMSNSKNPKFLSIT
jgi:hypothetical protein